MMKKYLLFYFIFLNLSTLYSQTIDIEFEYNFETEYDSEIVLSKQLDDGGYIIGARSFEKLSLNPLIKFNYEDYLIIRLDKDGNELWNVVLGDKYVDNLADLLVLKNGEYIVGGSSDSYLLGNKTAPNFGLSDYWILKLNDNGEVIWQKTYGGKENDFFSSMDLLSNNTIVLGGTSESKYSGNKKTGKYGYYSDYWVINIDFDGEILWQKNYGGYSIDSLASLKVTQENNIILGGHSFSQADGIKTEYSKGWSDYWIVKIDSDGNVIWDKTIGDKNIDAIKKISITKDNNILLQGYSNYYTKIDNGNGLDYDAYDLYLVKISIDDGSKLWQKYFSNKYNFMIENHEGDLICLSNHSEIIKNQEQFSEAVFSHYILIYDNEANFKEEIVVGNFTQKKYNKLIQTKDKSYLLTGFERVIGREINQEYKKKLSVIKLFHEIDLEDLQNNINIYPNAFSNQINIDYDKDVVVKMFAANGKKILETSNKNFILENLAVGYYFIRMYNTKGDLISINKLLKEY